MFKTTPTHIFSLSSVIILMEIMVIFSSLLWVYAGWREREREWWMAIIKSFLRHCLLLFIQMSSLAHSLLLPSMIPSVCCFAVEIYVLMAERATAVAGMRKEAIAYAYVHNVLVKWNGTFLFRLLRNTIKWKFIERKFLSLAFYYFIFGFDLLTFALLKEVESDVTLIALSGGGW